MPSSTHDAVFSVYFEKSSCVIDGANYASVMKFIAHVLGCGKDGARTTWKRLKKKEPSLEQAFRVHNFGGQAGEMIVGDAAALVKLLFRLRGHRAQAMQDAMREYLEDPSDECLAAVRVALDDIPSEDVSTEGSVDVVRESVRSMARAYDETCFYVRIRLPDQYIAPVRTPKQLTTQVVKFTEITGTT